MAVQVLGKVAYFNKGAYNSQTNYEINDVVSYNGSSYVSLNDNNQGNLPTNTNYWSVVAEKGDKGDTGKPFVIEKTYSTIESMVADYDNMNVNDYVMIQGSIEEQENATLWTKREVEVSPYKWAYLADFSGASGITGATPNIHIGNVTEGNEPSVTRRSGSSNENPILDFVLKTGAKGDTGATGNGISSIEKTSTSGLVDTYTITFTNGTSTTIEVTNGRGIVSIAKTSSVDYVDTYTITYNDGTTSTFEVANSEVTEEEFDDVVDELNYLYDDLPKVEGEGTSLTLNNTRKGKMSNVLRGNTIQNSTTGKNLLNPSVATLNCSVSNGLITITTNSTDVYIQGAYVYSEANKFLTLGAGSYYIKSTNPNVRITCYGDAGSLDTTLDQPRTLNSTTNFGGIRVRSSSSLQNVTFGIMLSTEDIDYEPYTNGASPNPYYPQDVHVVSGDNTIKVEGKNLFDEVFRQGNQHNNWNTARIFSNKNDWKVNVGDKITFSTNLDLTTFDYSFYIMQYPYLSVSSNTMLYASNYQTTNTFTINCEYEGYFGFTIRKKNESNLTPSDVSNYWFQIEKGSTATPYEPYQSASYPINLGVENLIDFNRTQGTYTGNGTTFEEGKYFINMARDSGAGSNTEVVSYQDGILTIKALYNQGIGYPIKCKPNKSYFVKATGGDSNSRLWLSFFTQDGTFISGSDNTLDLQRTAISPSNAYWIIPIFARYGTSSGNTTFSEIKVIEGNKEQYISDTPIELCKIGDYQDYIYKDNGKWYKHSEIGKVVLDGSENWLDRQAGFTNYLSLKLSFSGAITHSGLCNNFVYNSSYDLVQEHFLINKTWQEIVITILKSRLNTADATGFKNWLNTHNTIIYYVLETPTNTEITDQTLIAQLDNFEKALSYNTQTNISQENNDLPFIISASAFMSLKYLFGNLETRVAELEG